MAYRITLFITLLSLALSIIGCGSASQCPRGHKLREENYPDGGQVKARGCLEDVSDGTRPMQGQWEFFHPNGQKQAEATFKEGNTFLKRLKLLGCFVAAGAGFCFFHSFVSSESGQNS